MSALLTETRSPGVSSAALTINTAFMQEIKEASGELWALLDKLAELLDRRFVLAQVERPRQPDRMLRFIPAALRTTCFIAWRSHFENARRDQSQNDSAGADNLQRQTDPTRDTPDRRC